MSADGNDIDGRDEDDVLVAEYVLGVLSAADHARMAARIARDPRLAAEARFWQSRFSALDQDFAETSPPANFVRRIEHRLFGEEVPTRTSFWDNLLLWRGVAGASLALAVLSLGFSFLQPRAVIPEELAIKLVAALEAEGSDVRFLALYDPDTGQVRLTGLSGDVEAGRDLELWMIEGGNRPVSMGLVEANAHNVMSLEQELATHFDPGTTLAVTVEPEGGSPSGDPTGPIVASGTTVAI